MGLYLLTCLTVFSAVNSQRGFVSGQSAPLPRTDYVGCFSTLYLEDNSTRYKYNKLRFTYSWDEGVRGCEHRLTTHMGVQTDYNDRLDFFSHIHCDSDLAKMSRRVNDSRCDPCVEAGISATDRLCGRVDSTVAVYKLRDRVPLAVMLAVEDVGVIMIRDDSSNMSLLVRHNTTPTSLDYNYEDDEIVLANQTVASRFFYNFDTSKYEITADVPTCNGSVLRSPVIDWENKEVIYGCDHNRMLQAVDFVGDLYAKNILTHNHYFHDIAYDPYQKQVFFTNLGDKAFRYELEPKPTTELTKKGLLTKGRTLSADVHNQKLYVVGETATTPAGQAALVSMDYDGSKPQIVYQGPELAGGTVKLDVFDKTVVWVGYDNALKRSIAYRCDLNANNVCEQAKIKRLIVSIKNLNDLKIYHPLKQASESELNNSQPSTGSSTGTQEGVKDKISGSVNCPPLEGNKVVCKNKGEVLPCENNGVPPGTTATQRCRDLHNHLYLPESTTLNCLESGEWDYPRFYCTAECGIPSNNITVTESIINGDEAERGEYPWQAALYMRKMPNGTVSDTWQQLCGATLISPRLVLTAAHCLDGYKDDKLPAGYGKLQAVDVKVGLGKIFRDFYRAEPFSIIADVREIVIPRLYLGSKSNFAFDIALLHLTERVHFNDYIRPACVDWDQAITFTTGEKVHVAGWGNTERSEPSEVLLCTKLSFVELLSCVEKLTGTSQKQVHITYDKFCAQSVNGSQVSHGDSGGGMTAVRNKQHFIIGLVSARLSTNFDYSMFTNIQASDHFSWLQRERTRLSSV